MDNKNYRKLIWTAVVILVFVIGISAALVDFDSLLETLKGVIIGWLLLGVVCLLMGIVLITVRWRFFLPDKPSFALTFHSNSVSYMLRLLIPIPLAVVRLVIFSLVTSVDIYQAAPMMIIERFLELVMRLVALSLAIVLILGIPLWIDGGFILAILLLALPTFVMWLSRNISTAAPRLIERSAGSLNLNKEKLREAMVDFQNNVLTMRTTHRLTTGVFYSLAMWGLFLLFYICGFYSLGLNLEFWEITAMSATILAILPPSTPAMIGVYQSVIVAILLPFGYFDVNTATAYALLVVGAQLVVWIVLGVLGLRRTDFKISQLSQKSLDEQDLSE